MDENINLSLQIVYFMFTQVMEMWIPKGFQKWKKDKCLHGVLEFLVSVGVRHDMQVATLLEMSVLLWQWVKAKHEARKDVHATN